MNRLFIIAVFLLPFFQFIKAQDSLAADQVVITGTRFEIPTQQSGKTIYKITQEDIQRNQGSDIHELLNQVPGISFTSGVFGTPGSNIQYSSRGGREEQLLIRIDGVPVNDPSSITALYDLRLLAMDQVESIEILKGGLSTLYGSSASTGVVNITLKKPVQGKPISGSLGVHAGSFGTIGASSVLSGHKDQHSYTATFNIENYNGFSAASDQLATAPFDDDGMDKWNAILQYRYQANDRLSIGLLGMLNNIDLEFDGGAFADGFNEQIVNEFRIGLSPKYIYNRGSVQLNAAYTIGNRDFIFYNDATLTSGFELDFDTRYLNMDLSQKHQFHNSLTAVWGLQWQQLSYISDPMSDFEETRNNLIDPYFSLFYNPIRALSIHAGARLNHHSQYGEKWIFNLNPSYLMKIDEDTFLKLFSSISTSFNAPSSFQLFDPFSGNTDLSPEESTNYELGTALYLNEIFTFNLAYFTRNERDPIEYVCSIFNTMFNFCEVGNYANVSGRKVSGIETDLNWNISSQWSFLANYTHISSDDESTLFRLPKNKVNAGIQFAAAQQTAVRLNYLFTGPRDENNDIVLDSYHTFDLFLQQKVLESRITIYGSLNNILDESFVDVPGFTTRGRNWRLGVRWNL